MVLRNINFSQTTNITMQMRFRSANKIEPTITASFTSDSVVDSSHKNTVRPRRAWSCWIGTRKESWHRCPFRRVSSVKVGTSSDHIPKRCSLDWTDSGGVKSIEADEVANVRRARFLPTTTRGHRMGRRFEVRQVPTAHRSIDLCSWSTEARPNPI